MKQEDKELLLKDLCARLLYGVFLKIGEYSDYTLQGIVLSNINKPLLVECNGSDFECSIEVVRPYLRPMSSMTEEEVFEYLSVCNKDNKDTLTAPRYLGLDYLLSHHFDYRGLIERDLAIEAPEGMYNLKEK